MNHPDFHHRNHPHPHRPAADLSHFWVITIISNPVRYRRRYELYWRFKEMCESAGVKLITVEQAFGHRPFMVTEHCNPFHLQIRTVEEVWHKENMINLGIRHAQHVACQMGLHVREVAWIDADCRPARTPVDWFEETWHQLQHYQFVQMWETLIDLDPEHNPIGEGQPGFMANYIKYGTPNPEVFRKIEFENQYDYPGSSFIFGRPGLAWAANIEALNHVGGLIDYAVLGAGDWYMAHGLVGSLVSARSEFAEGPYMAKMLEWQARAQRWLKRDVGYVPGMVYHDFHGKKAFRQYGTRGRILSECKYNPETDIKYDHQGLLQLETHDDRQILLRDRIRAYFRARNEDDISL